MKRVLVLALALVASTTLTPPQAGATLLFSDISSWFADGRVVIYDNINGTNTTVRGPGGIPINGGGASNLLVKVEEDVITYDPLLHPFVPVGVDRYLYTITNVAFDSGNVPYTSPGASTVGPGTNGISGFTLDLGLVGVMAQGLPPNDPVTGLPWVQGAGPGFRTWQLENPGLGIGAPHPASPISMNSFFIDVAAGTTHGVAGASVNSHTANNLATNFFTGYVTAPIPEPGSLLLLGTGLLGATAAIRRRKRI